jgi:hypothetical protein
VDPPTPETEGLRDLLRCRDDLRCARIAARHRVLKRDRHPQTRLVPRHLALLTRHRAYQPARHRQTTSPSSSPTRPSRTST